MLGEIVIILIVLIYILRNTFIRNWLNELEWKSTQAWKILCQLALRFGLPTIMGINVAVWNDEVFSKITVMDTERCVTISMPLKFFYKIQNMTINLSAYREMLLGIHKLTDCISYDQTTRYFNIHTTNWTDALKTAMLLIKLTACYTSVDDIKNRNLFKKYEDRCAEKPARYEQKIIAYISDSDLEC
jgi:hypothetical protein